jgi:hypothetical protein
MPLKDEEKEPVKSNVMKILKEKYGIEEEDFISAEIEIVPAGPARDYGLDRSMVAGYGHDDRVCAYSSLMALLDTEEVEETETDSMRLLWRSEFKNFILIMLINSVLCLAVIAIMYYYGAPIIYGLLPNPWSGIVTAFVTLSICGPFLWALMRRGGNSDNVNKLWYEGGRIERIKLTAWGILRLAVGAAFIAYIIGNTLPTSGLLGIFAVLAVALYIFLSPRLEKRSDKLSKTFIDNLNIREQ